MPACYLHASSNNKETLIYSLNSGNSFFFGTLKLHQQYFVFYLNTDDYIKF